MAVLRRILAFPIAALVWLFFPAICFAVITQTLDQVPDGVPFIVPCLLAPSASLGMVLLILPSGKRSYLATSIIGFTTFCVIGICIVGFFVGLGGGKNVFTLLICEAIGTIVGFPMALAGVKLKSDDT